MANDINYELDHENDSRLTSIKDEFVVEDNKLTETTDKMLTNTDKYYEEAKQGVEDYKKTQTDLANQSLNLTLQEIEQNKADTKKDYIKEQSGAYVDWQKQSNDYGANAEQMASTGLTNTGYSESSQVSMYNTYQNRVATARESFNRAVVDYNNQISQARIANDTLLAEIAYNSLQKQTELAIEQAQYKNQLLSDLADKRTALKSSYWQRYSDMMTAIQREIAQKEEARQYNLSLEQEKKKNKAYIDNLNAETALKKYELEQKQAAGSIDGGSGDGKTKRTASNTGSKYYNNKVRQTRANESAIGNKSGGKQLPNAGALDLSSAVALLGGAPSGKSLANAVNDGKATTTNKNGKLAFKPSARWITDNMLYSKHGFD